MIVIADTTPLSQLAKIGRLDLLPAVYGRVAVPQEVFREVTRGAHPAVEMVRAATWIDVLDLPDPASVRSLQAETGLDEGECAAIVLAENTPNSLLLVDDKAARRATLSRGVRVGGTVATLLLAKNRGLIPSVKCVLDELISCGTRIGRRLYHEAIEAAGE